MDPPEQPLLRLHNAIVATPAGRPLDTSDSSYHDQDGKPMFYPRGWQLQPRGIARAFEYMDLPTTADGDGERQDTNLDQLCRAIRDEDAREYRPGRRSKPLHAPRARTPGPGYPTSPPAPPPLLPSLICPMNCASR
ncbi:hypothetical protein [Actinacidiphila soli]|uniref:hypothetical protein n=1 Tax=Actinacidiphila soli TaxID=2487275 RepID=UPI000FCCB67D|nr:hypothetical protein [Actinacidiphila soli]